MFPPFGVMVVNTAADEKVHLGHFYVSPRHRMQVDFNTYVRDLLEEIDRGVARSATLASFET